MTEASLLISFINYIKKNLDIFVFFTDGLTLLCEFFFYILTKIFITLGPEDTAENGHPDNAEI